METDETDLSCEGTNISEKLDPLTPSSEAFDSLTKAVQLPFDLDRNANDSGLLKEAEYGLESLTQSNSAPTNACQLANQINLPTGSILHRLSVQKDDTNTTSTAFVKCSKSDTEDKCKNREQFLQTDHKECTEPNYLHTSVNSKLCKAYSTGNVASIVEKHELKVNEEVTASQQELHRSIERRIPEVSSASTLSSESPIYKPTLADDSRSVKISLPTNPINLMQTNAQFLNKSRNFINFLTENSKNIMGKALHSQQIVVNYNSVLKSIHGSYGEKKYSDDFNVAINSSPLQEAQDVVQEVVTNSQNNNENCRANDEHQAAIKNIIPSSTSMISEQQSIPMQMNGMSSVHRNCANMDVSTLKLNNLNQSDSSSTNDQAKTNISLSEDVANTYVYETGSITVPENIETQEGSLVGLVNNTVHSKEELMQHLAHQALLKDYMDLKAQNLKLQEKVEYLEEQNRLDAEIKARLALQENDTWEETINKLRAELQSSVMSQEVLKKEYDIANKERESMVMKYAVGEKQLIDNQRAKDTAERKVKDLTREQELLQNKLRQAQGERARICNVLDKRCREVTDLQKEVERLKEDVKMRDIKLKWTQNKLMTEMETQKETQQKLDKAMTRINEVKEECEQVRKDSEESIRRFQQSEENKAVTLDQQLKEQQARLILERHVTEDKEMLRIQLQKEVDTLKHRQQILIEENNNLSLKIQEAEKNRSSYESNLCNLQAVADQQQRAIDDLLAKVSELETLKAQLQQKEQILEKTNGEIEDLRLANEELQNDMRACRAREADMLDFTQKLTYMNVRIQSEFNALEIKAKQLEEEHGPLHERISQLIARIGTLEANLAQEQKARIEECEILARHLAEQTQAAQNLAQKLEDSQGENAVLKRKQQITVKELTRELQQCRKRLEAFEAASPCNSLDVASRTGSNASLNTGDTLNGALSDNSANGDHPIQSAEPSRQALIDRIIKLQRINVKRAEKLDFLEEHTRTLVEELQKKTKIIQSYILHEDFGAMGSNERDRHKAELARHGGIMASVYNQRVSDENMTLELSLEINQKLQAVLEDALLKNITLKDNIDTLGEEIARLTMKNQQKQI